MKRGIILFLTVFLSTLVIAGFVLAEEATPSATDLSTVSSSTTSSEGGSGSYPPEGVVTETTQQTDATASTSTETDTGITPDGDSSIDEDSSNSAEEFNVDPGITPDNALYFVDDLVESFSVGNSPEKALDYKEEKIAEARAMIEKNKPEEAAEVLDKALKYDDILEKEVSPEMRERVKESSTKVNYVLENMKKKAGEEGWRDLDDRFNRNLEKEKRINSAGELVAKINELCQTLAKIDPLQYADSCRTKDNSPKWMKEKDKELTKEQKENARIFIEKLSQCFESPENCDCKGMRVQSFEDFCIEKSSLASKCKQGDKDSCKEFEKGAGPSELLPDYLVSSFKKVESRYMKSEFETNIPEECEKAGAKTFEECNKVMFRLISPEECLDAGLTGKSKEDEIKCKRIMFEKNIPKECLDAGLTADDSDAPRKCAKIMFQKRSPEECINAGITGERKDDEKRCRGLMINEKEGRKNEGYAPKFNRDCNSIKDIDEKMKCYEEFYNNAQIQVKEDFREREFEGRSSRDFAAKMGAANPDRPCPDGVCDQWEREHPMDCPEDCGGKREGNCQSNEQIERLKQDCRNRGQEANIEDRGGCQWVICIGGYGVKRERESFQQTGERKCPDNICDEYERMNPYACPEDCGGVRESYREREFENRREEFQQPMQEQFRGCQGIPPSCGENNPNAFCENGNWICPQNRQEQIIQQPVPDQQPRQPEQQPTPQIEQPQQQFQQPVQEQPIQDPSQPVEQQPQPVQEQQVAPNEFTGRVVEVDKENKIQKDFWDYWFVR